MRIDVKNYFNFYFYSKEKGPLDKSGPTTTGIIYYPISMYHN